MTIEQIISILGQLATWVTVVLVYLTVREMAKQRKAAQKPELIIPDVSISGYSTEQDEIFIASHWNNKELKNEGIAVGRFPKIAIYNIGAGAAKEINIKWEFDMQDTIKSIQDYCYRNSIPVVVRSQDNFLQVEFKGRESFISISASSNLEHAYLMPASVTAQGLESDLPLTFLELISILIFLRFHQSNKKSSKDKVVFPVVEEANLEIPSLYCELSYADVGGEKYMKKFDVTFDPFLMRYPAKGIEFPVTEPVFQGVFEFKEKNECSKIPCPTQRAPDPRKSTGTVVVGVGAFSGGLRGLELAPSKWRPLVPPTSG